MNKFELCNGRFKNFVALAAGCLGVYFVRVAGQRFAAGISQPEFGDSPPGPGTVLIGI